MAASGPLLQNSAFFHIGVQEPAFLENALLKALVNLHQKSHVRQSSSLLENTSCLNFPSK